MYNELNERPGLVALRSDVPRGNVPEELWARANDPNLKIVDYDTPAYQKADEESKAWWQGIFKELNLQP